MDHALTVQLVERREKLPSERHHLIQRERLLARQPVREILAFPMGEHRV